MSVLPASTGLRCLFAALLLCALPQVAWAGAVAPVTACNADKLPLAAAARMIGSPDGMLTAETVASLPATQMQLVIAGRRVFNSSWDWWLRVDLHNGTDAACQRWLQVGPARLRDVRAYVRQADGWQVMRSGTAHPLSEWALATRLPVFPLTLPAHSVTRVLIRLVGRGEVLAFAPQLWSPVAFQKAQSRQSLYRGLQYGAVVVLVLISLALSAIYRRSALCYMALAVGAFVVYLAAQANYLFLYLWPQMPGFNLWLRYFLSGLFFAALYSYLYEIVRVRQLGRWWRCLFAAAGCAFAFVALFGGLIHAPTLTTLLMFGSDTLCRWALAAACIIGWWRRTQRHIYPPLLVGLLCLQSIQIYGQLLGLDIPSPGGFHAYVSTIAVAGFFLLGTLINQVRQGRLAGLNARREWGRQHRMEQQRLAATVVERTVELEGALNLRQQLLARVSHDLRSPLVGMINAVQQSRGGDRSRDYPQLVEGHARQQMDMIDELLEYSRTESTALQLQVTPGRLRSFLDEVGNQMDLLAAGDGNCLHRDFAADLPAQVSLDFRYLRRVLVNLLGNASKFTDQGDIRLSVQAWPAPDADQVCLQFIVDDNGPGIAAIDRERLQLPFARGANTLQQEGHGLGLAIVTQLLSLMDSRLHVDDAPGGGSRFHFQLYANLAANSKPDVVVAADGSATAINTAKKRINART